jgi:hypothetical protein
MDVSLQMPLALRREANKGHRKQQKGVRLPEPLSGKTCRFYLVAIAVVVTIVIVVVMRAARSVVAGIAIAAIVVVLAVTVLATVAIAVLTIAVLAIAVLAIPVLARAPLTALTAAMTVIGA